MTTTRRTAWIVAGEGRRHPSLWSAQQRAESVHRGHISWWGRVQHHPSGTAVCCGHDASGAVVVTLKKIVLDVPEES